MNQTSVTEELAAGRPVTFFTVGVSMRPLLRERETHVRIVPLSESRSELRERDIVLYVRRSGRLVLHRLIKQDANALYMRGDNTYGLERIERAQAIGVVEQIWRKGQYIDVQNDRRYHRYVTRRLLNYPIRYVIYQMYRLPVRMWHAIRRR